MRLATGPVRTAWLTLKAEQNRTKQKRANNSADKREWIWWRLDSLLRGIQVVSTLHYSGTAASGMILASIFGHGLGMNKLCIFTTVINISINQPATGGRRMPLIDRQRAACLSTIRYSTLLQYIAGITAEMNNRYYPGMPRKYSTKYSFYILNDRYQNSDSLLCRRSIDVGGGGCDISSIEIVNQWQWQTRTWTNQPEYVMSVIQEEQMTWR